MLDGFNEGWIEFERDGTEHVLGDTPFEIGGGGIGQADRLSAARPEMPDCRTDRTS